MVDTSMFSSMSFLASSVRHLRRELAVVAPLAMQNQHFCSHLALERQ
jgi:hypothetical protein